MSATVRRLNVSRRAFAISTASALLARRPTSACVPPSEQITLGIVGLGSRGFNLLDAFVSDERCRIVALCDVDQRHFRDGVWGRGTAYGRDPARQRVEAAYADAKSGTAAKGIHVTADYRDVCRRDDIDAVVVATPDHWHALCVMDALKSGKDVYCEKPVTHLFREGQLVVAEVARQNAVFQTGSQQRSDRLFRHAVELARNGVLGQVESFEVGLPPGYDKPQGSTEVQSPPEHLDYDFWCGPAPKLPYMRARHHRWWRGHSAFGGGVLMDWIGHHNDIAHWAINVERSGPTLVEAVDWKFPDSDVYDTPREYTIRCEYPGGIASSVSSHNRPGLKLIGSDGWVHVDRGKIAASDDRWLQSGFRPGSEAVYESNDHTGNFLECVRSRRECIAPADVAHRSITPGHLAYVSHRLQQPLKWNADAQRVENSDEANRLLSSVSYREPWQLSATG